MVYPDGEKENMELIRHYFPDLTDRQQEQLAALGPLYSDWNDKINVISRKDIAHLYLHHVGHSLAIARYTKFEAGMQVLDAGTGGGFPGIPLAILFPEVQFTLLDATAKKIKVVEAIAKAIGLTNVKPLQSRLEDHLGEYDMVISRAVSDMAQMVAWTRHLMHRRRWIFLKGGLVKELRKELPPRYKMTFTPIQGYFRDAWFEEKYIVEVEEV
jgi:16S rRNA (guanine527-N7)-methyltransferase